MRMRLLKSLVSSAYDVNMPDSKTCDECLAIRAAWAAAMKAARRIAKEHEQAATLPMAARLFKMNYGDRKALADAFTETGISEVRRRSERHSRLTGHAGPFSPSNN